MPANTLLDDLKRLGAAGGTRKNKGLPSLVDLPPIPARLGAALPQADSGSGSGIGSPIIEDDPSGRTYFAEQNMTTTDGTVYGKWKQIQQLNMTDNTGAPLVFIFRYYTPP